MSTGRTFLSLWHGQLPWPEPHRTMCEIAREVCQARGVTLDDLRGRSTARAAAWPRQEFMALAYAGGHNKCKIGRWLKRDHTTVLAGVRRHKAREAAVSTGSRNLLVEVWIVSPSDANGTMLSA